jgi:molybdopterin-guanine dinucleotide biosynthesis protein A
MGIEIGNGPRPGRARSRIERADITGLILAGGKATRMGGTDKGLAQCNGEPMAQSALRRLTPQVDCVMISANRNAEIYAGFGCPVFRDDEPEFGCPLAGVLTALRRCPTRYLLTIPCDSPFIPLDLAMRMAETMSRTGCGAVFAANIEREAGKTWLQAQPVFSLLPTSSAESLEAYLAQGRGKILTWGASLGLGVARFDDPMGFANCNTIESLRALEAIAPDRRITAC